MKGIFILLLMLINLSAYSQDILIKKNGDDMKVKVVEITKDEIKYKKIENLDGPVYSILKNETFMIRYQNGTKETFIEPQNDKNVNEINTFSNSINKNSILPVGTMVKFTSENKITGRKAKEGDELTFKLKDQLFANNILIAKEGSIIKGKITRVSHKGMIGKEGQLEFSVDYLIANNGTKIKLTSENKLSGGHQTVGRVIGTIMLTPFFLLTSGSEAKIKKDQEFVAYVDAN